MLRPLEETFQQIAKDFRLHNNNPPPYTPEQFEREAHIAPVLENQKNYKAALQEYFNALRVGMKINRKHEDVLEMALGMIRVAGAMRNSAP